jgi:hypothetical protein
MQRRKKLLFLLFILVFSNLNLSKFKNSIANPSYVTIIPYSGGLLPAENVSLSLTNANIIIDADMSNLNYHGPIKINANYTIFNPDEDINITIGAPFTFHTPENCSVLLNGTDVTYDIIYDDELYDYQIDIWNQYLHNRSSYEIIDFFPFDGFWIIVNVSIPQNTEVILSYEFQTPQESWYIVEGYYKIVYDVGTARLWNGNITEKVEITVYGHLPNSIYEPELCVISDLLEGKSYCWNWDNQRIEIDYVGLYYYFNFDDYYNPFYFGIKISLMTVVTLLGISVILVKKYYRKSKFRSN